MCFSGTQPDSTLPGERAASLREANLLPSLRAPASLIHVSEESISRGGCLLSAAELESSKLFVQDESDTVAYISYQVGGKDVVAVTSLTAW